MVLAPAPLHIAHGAEPVVLFDFEGVGHARNALLTQGRELACPTGTNSPFEHKGQFSELSNRRRSAASRTSQPLHRRGSVGIPSNQEEGHGAASLASVAERKVMHHEKYATPWRHASLTM
jgi:hypothetical protein